MVSIWKSSGDFHGAMGHTSQSWYTNTRFCGEPKMASEGVIKVDDSFYTLYTSIYFPENEGF